MNGRPEIWSDELKYLEKLALQFSLMEGQFACVWGGLQSKCPFTPSVMLYTSRGVLAIAMFRDDKISEVNS